jgi:hypothetical protein
MRAPLTDRGRRRCAAGASSDTGATVTGMRASRRLGIGIVPSGSRDELRWSRSCRGTRAGWPTGADDRLAFERAHGARTPEAWFKGLPRTTAARPAPPHGVPVLGIGSSWDYGDSPGDDRVVGGQAYYVARDTGSRSRRDL